MFEQNLFFMLLLKAGDGKKDKKEDGADGDLKMEVVKSEPAK